VISSIDEATQRKELEMHLNRNERMVLSTIIAGLAVIGLFLLLNGTAQIARADPGPPLFASTTGAGTACAQDDPCTLSTALDQAADGDTIYVAQGTYTGSGQAVITVTHTITVYGGWDGAAGGPVSRDPDAYPTILDGQGQRRVVFINGTISPVIDGFTITGGNGSSATPYPGYGGGILSTYGAPLIANNVISHNVAYTSTSSVGYGGGICVRNSAAIVISGNVVISNVASTGYTGNGGGIYVLGASSARVMNNVVLSNTASVTGGLGDGGGIYFLSSDGTIVTGNRVAHNVGQGGPAEKFGSYGGGIYCDSSAKAKIADNVIEHNVASVPANGAGGGIAVSSCSPLTVSGNTLSENVGSAGTTAGGGRGGGLFAYAARDLLIEANRVVSNTASTFMGWGGGFYISRNTIFTMTNNVVAANHANYKGGGMAFETGSDEPITGTLVHNTFAGNDQGSDDGRIAIHINDAYVTLALTNNLIYSHTYGLYAVGPSAAQLDHTLFYGNSSGDTGGLGSISNTAPITGQDPLLDADYHLQSGSPAIDAGRVLSRPETDIDGDPRPDGAGYDVGADEYAFLHIYLPLTLRNAP
jgi:hypothetical protein